MNFCSICETDKNPNEFIYPCKCKFPVHKTCLQKLRKIHESNECNLCKTTYKFADTSFENMVEIVEQKSKQLYKVHHNFKTHYVDIYNSLFLSYIKDSGFLALHVDCLNTYISRTLDLCKSIYSELDYLFEQKYEKYMDLILFVVQELKDMITSLKSFIKFENIHIKFLEDHYKIFYKKYLKYVIVKLL
jgi:hypothetical protein